METTKSELQEVTALLQAWADGDLLAGDRLFPLICDELHRLSRDGLLRQNGTLTERAKRVIEYAWADLFGEELGDRHDRAHFFALAAPMMRSILSEQARRRLEGIEAHGDEAASETGADDVQISDLEARETLRLDEVISGLAAEDGRRAQVVILRWFAGMEVEAVAEVMQIDPAVAATDWKAGCAAMRNGA